jgi:hypothetical protein
MRVSAIDDRSVDRVFRPRRRSRRAVSGPETSDQPLTAHDRGFREMRAAATRLGSVCEAQGWARAVAACNRVAAGP